MPYTTSTTNNTINVVLNNDLSGTLSNPYVVSVNNVKYGILQVENGGLGGYTIPFGTILLGNGVLRPNYLSGSDGDIISWSAVSGSWNAVPFNGVQSLNFTIDSNPIFQLTDTSFGKDKTYGISFKDIPQNMFLAGPLFDITGSLEARYIGTSDLPSIISDKTFLNSTLQGNVTGNILADNIISLGITGSGAGLYDLRSSQINDFIQEVQSIINSDNFSYNYLTVSTASISNASINNATINGTFIGDGSEIENINPNNISNLTNIIRASFTSGQNIDITSGTISFTGSLYSFTSSNGNILVNTLQNGNISLELNNDLAINQLTSSDASLLKAKIYNLNSDLIISDHLSGNFFGKYYGSGEEITNIPNSSLEKSYIILNGNTVNLGDSLQVSGISSVSSSNSNITTTLNGDVVYLNFKTNPEFLYVSSSVFTGSFYGDGSNLTNISINNLGNIQQLINNNINLDNYNLILDSNERIALSPSIGVTSLNANSIYSYSGSYNELEVNILSSSYIYGNGYNITNIDARNIINVDEIFNAAFTGSDNITVNSSGQTTFVSLKNNISLQSVTASLSGDGSSITNITSPLYKVFTGSGFSTGDVVCMTSSGLAKADNRYSSTNKPFGVVSSVNQSLVTVQMTGEVTITHLISNPSYGNIVYLGTSGVGNSYSSINTGCYAVELGTISDTNKILLNFKRLWKIG
jgi:hypothetical protein